MIDFEIKDDEQLKCVLQFKDDLIHTYDEMMFSKDIDRKAFLKIKYILESLSNAIKSYIEKSKNFFQIKCLENTIIEPQNTSEIKTNISEFVLQDIDIIFNGSIPSAGYLELRSFYIGICVKNNVPREALEKLDICICHYCDPMTTRYFIPGIYLIEKGTTIGVGYSEDKEFVKYIKRNMLR